MPSPQIKPQEQLIAEACTRLTQQRSGWIGVLIALSFSLVLGCTSQTTVPIDLAPAKFVGSSSCAECHRAEVDKHAGSHHALAMQLATEHTVLGDFNDTSLDHHGVHSRMFRDHDKFMIHTEGPDGQMRDYEIAYVFGLTPLQQYMVEFPSEDRDTSTATSGIPRVQVLPICWDTNAKKWFYLDPPDVKEKLDPHDDLHWTGIAQRWNTMCAECHSTDYQKNFEPGEFKDLVGHLPQSVNQANSKIGNYRSTFKEINVACEACHGPASQHVELARAYGPDWKGQGGFALANLKLSAESQIQACAPCHSRRSVIAAGFVAGDNYYDFHQENLLVWPVYYPDGQVLDEDYVHGSFVQSKMYHKGIRCSDCHDPHTATLKHDGNQVCTSCHQHPAAKYDSPAHHFHKAGSEGAQCVNCHMPATTYMQVDARRDHSLRIPRPDMSLKMQTPNACTGCHLKIENVAEDKRDKLRLYQDWMLAAREGDQEVAAEIARADQWCNEACDKWYGDNRRREDHWGVAIHAGQQRQPDAVDQLTQLLKTRGEQAPAIARATALQVLADVDPRAAGEAAAESITDPHPQVRAAAATFLSGLHDQSAAVALLEAALEDTVRSVRVTAAQQLLQFDPSLRSARGRALLDRAIEELKQGLMYSNDRAGSHLSLGTIYEQMGMDQQAIKQYETAIVVEPAMAGPRTNLAAVLSRNLESAGSMPQNLRAQLTEETNQLRATELQLLERDIGLLPNPPAPLIYRYGLSLYLAGRVDEAAVQLTRAAEADTADPSYAETAALIYEKLGKLDQAIRWAEQACQRDPNRPESSLLLQELQTKQRNR